MAEVPICIYPSGYTLSGAEQSRYAAGHRYTSQSAMESGEDTTDWVTAGDNPLVEIIGGDATYNWDGNPDTTNVSYNGWTLSSTYYLTVKTIGTARPDYSSGWDSTAYICAKITLGSSNTMYCHFDGIQSTVAGTCLLMADPLVNAEFANCYFKATGDTANNIWVTSTSTATIRIWNSIIENGTHGVKFSSANISMYMYHCVVTDISDDAVETDNNNLYPINCPVFNNLDDWRDLFPTGYPNYCASDDNDVGSNGIDISPGASEPDDWNNAFTDYSNGDFSIKDTNSVLYNAGLDLSNEFTDLTGNTDPLGTDILGNTRSTWDVGPYAWVSATGYVDLDGIIASTSNSTGDLTALLSLGAELASISNFTSVLTRLRSLQANASSVSDLQSLLTLLISLIGSVSNISDVSSILKRSRSFQGDVSSVSQLQTILTRLKSLQADIASISGIIAELTIQGAVDLSASIDSVSDISSNLTRMLSLVAEISSISDAIGTLTTTFYVDLSGSINSLSDIQSVLTKLLSLVSSLDSVSESTSNLTRLVSLVADLNSISSVSSLLSRLVSFQSDLTTISELIATLTTEISEALLEFLELNSYITEEIELSSPIEKEIKLNSSITKELELVSKIDFIIM